jgi:hypothetical protein
MIGKYFLHIEFVPRKIMINHRECAFATEFAHDGVSAQCLFEFDFTAAAQHPDTE